MRVGTALCPDSDAINRDEGSTEHFKQVGPEEQERRGGSQTRPLPRLKRPRPARRRAAPRPDGFGPVSEWDVLLYALSPADGSLGLYGAETGSRGAALCEMLGDLQSINTFYLIIKAN